MTLPNLWKMGDERRTQLGSNRDSKSAVESDCYAQVKAAIALVYASKGIRGFFEYLLFWRSHAPDGIVREQSRPTKC